EGAIAHELKEAPAMLRDRRHQDLAAARAQPRHGAGLITLYQPAVADHIGGENGGETALRAFFGHLSRLVSGKCRTRILFSACRGVYRSGLPLRVTSRPPSDCGRSGLGSKAVVGGAGLAVSFVPGAAAHAYMDFRGAAR